MSNEENNGNEEGRAAPEQKPAAAAEAKSPDSKSSNQLQKSTEPTEMEGVTIIPDTSDKTSTSVSTDATTTTTTSSTTSSTNTASGNTTTHQPSTSTNTNTSTTNTTLSDTTMESQSDSIDIHDKTTNESSMLTDQIDSASDKTADSMLDVAVDASLATDESLTTDVTSPAEGTEVQLTDVIKRKLTDFQQSGSEAESAKVGEDATEERVAFKVTYDKKKYDVELPVSTKILDLKKHLASKIDVPHSMQKVMIKGLAGDDKTLAELGVTRTSKVMVVGSTFNEVLGVNKKQGSKAAGAARLARAGIRERLCLQAVHKKVLDKGVPDDVHPGIRFPQEPLPPHPISGMVNKLGGKVRLTFKLELDQVWIGTKQRTEKVNMSSIQAVTSESILGQEMYHIMGLQLGPTEASNYWLYWVPAQYVDAIKRTIMGGR